MIEPEMKYLAGYPAQLQTQVSDLLAEDKLGEFLLKKYPLGHDVRTDRALYQYVQDLKSEFIRSAEPISKIVFDSKLHVIRNALGTHTYISRVQGGKLKAKNEIRIATLFRETPAAFLQMIAVHELAHVKEKQHDKAFYKLCTYMQPDYHQTEFDLRMYLTYLESGKPALWSAGPNS